MQSFHGSLRPLYTFNVKFIPDFEASQNRLRALRSRQDLFQEEGVLNMILDTIDKFSQMESMPDFAGLLNDDTQVTETAVVFLNMMIKT